MPVHDEKGGSLSILTISVEKSEDTEDGFEQILIEQENLIKEITFGCSLAPSMLLRHINAQQKSKYMNKQKCSVLLLRQSPRPPRTNEIGPADRARTKAHRPNSRLHWSPPLNPVRTSCSTRTKGGNPHIPSFVQSFPPISEVAQRIEAKATHTADRNRTPTRKCHHREKSTCALLAPTDRTRRDDILSS